ncbi:MAG: hypothetical protein Q9201_002349 [Fulgogasparrea decipioides]
MAYQASPRKKSKRAFGKVRKEERFRKMVHSGKTTMKALTLERQPSSTRRRSIQTMGRLLVWMQLDALRRYKRDPDRPLSVASYHECSHVRSNECKVIRSTFSAIQPSPGTVPESLIASLLHRFASNEGYRLYDDVIPFFRRLHDWRTTTEAASAAKLDPSRVQVGVISNSDDRVTSILASLGLRVNTQRWGSATAGESKGTLDIDWMAMSHDVGFEKPDRRIFEAAKKLSAFASESDGLYLHVGDNVEEDYRGALKAGWRSILLDRDVQHSGHVLKPERIQDLSSLMQTLQNLTEPELV